MKSLDLMVLVGAALVFSVSTDSLHAQAAGYGAPAALNSNADTDAGEDEAPQVATDGAGAWITIWYSNENLGGTAGTDWDIFFSRSTDNGLSWSPAAALNSNADSDSEQDFMADISTDGAGHWVVVWDSAENMGGTIGMDRDIFFTRSTDNGLSWSAVATLNSNATTDMGTDTPQGGINFGSGAWIANWFTNENLAGTAGTDYDIFFSRSTDRGMSWSPVATLNGNADTDAGIDLGPQTATDGAGNWVAVWWSEEDLGGTIGMDKDILVARSADDGVTWTPPAALNGNAGWDSGHDEWPQITTDGAGNWVAVWWSSENLGGTAGTDNDIFVSRSTDNGVSWSAAETLNSNADTDAGSDIRPHITTDGAGNWVAVWWSDEDLGGTAGTDNDIFFSRSADNGVSWSAVATLNTNAETDTETDLRPQVMTDGVGNWLAVWVSEENLGGAVGTDRDIFFSRSTDNGLNWGSPATLNTHDRHGDGG